MNTYLIDTNVIVDYLRQNKKISLWLNSLKYPKISVITVAELYQGVKNKKELKKIKQLIKKFHVLPINASVSSLAINLLEKHFLSSGLLILDALIAATAIEIKLILKTKNIKHFQMIRGLKVEK